MASLRNRPFARTVRLLGGLCALLVFVAVGSLSLRGLVAKRKTPFRTTEAVPEPVVEPPVTSTWIRVDPFLLDAPPFWRRQAVPDPCPSRDPLPILVLPHYIPLYSHIQKALATWSACARGGPIRRLVIISPDHHQRLTGGAATFSGSGYQTPLGEVPVDIGLRSLLEANGIPSVDGQFHDEHGVGVFPVFIRQAFPGATVLPIMISARATQSEVETVGEMLRPFVEDGTALILISADFSHYLTRPEADRHDQALEAAFARRDTTFVWAARDAYTDFGRGLWLGMRLAGNASFRLLERVNSAEIGGSAVRTTSFWFGWWER